MNPSIKYKITASYYCCCFTNTPQSLGQHYNKHTKKSHSVGIDWTHKNLAWNAGYIPSVTCTKVLLVHFM